MKSSEFKNIFKELNKRNIAIIGHMGSGKSIVGKMLAKQLDFQHIDSDQEIVKLTDKSINQIFEEKGEKYFRDVETKILFRLIEKENVVISLGGGAIREETTTTRAANIILEDNLNPNGNYSVLLETGNQLLKEGTDTVDISESTTFGNHFLLERTTLDGYANQTSDTIGGIFVQDENEKILINRYHEVDLNGRLLLNATDSSGTNAGEHLATENAGRRLVLEGTDSDESNIRDRLTFEDETGDGDIVLDGTDSDSVDAGDNIINESGIDFSNQDVTITDSSGASGTIVKVDIANVTSTVETTSTSIGEYSTVVFDENKIEFV